MHAGRNYPYRESRVVGWVETEKAGAGSQPQRRARYNAPNYHESGFPSSADHMENRALTVITTAGSMDTHSAFSEDKGVSENQTMLVAIISSYRFTAII